MIRDPPSVGNCLTIGKKKAAAAAVKSAAFSLLYGSHRWQALTFVCLGETNAPKLQVLPGVI